MPLYRTNHSYQNEVIRLLPGSVNYFDVAEAEQLNRDSAGLLTALENEELDAISAAIDDARTACGVNFRVDWSPPATPVNEWRGFGTI